VVEAVRVVEALEVDAADGACEACAEALPALAEDVATTLRHLGASSTPAVAAAREDLSALARRVAKLPGGETAATACTEAVQRLAAIATVLPAAATIDHGQPIPAAKTPADVKRLPPRLTKVELRRRLGVTEDEGASAADLFRGLGPAIKHVEAMARARRGKGREAASPVDEGRCEVVWVRISHYARMHDELTTKHDCEAVVRRLDGRRLTEAALMVALVDFELIDPTRSARQRKEAPIVALLTGRLAPSSQRHALRLAILAGLSGGDDALVVALDEARGAACLAATAVWIHGEVGSDDELGTRLKEHCALRTPAEWIAAAEARPMAALQGLPLRRLGEGPAEVVPLQHYWWAPSGLLDVLSRPELLASLPTKSTVDVKVEPLTEEP
jgi:hypothetical protein